MDEYFVRTEQDPNGKYVKAIGPADALKTIYPNFEWTYGIRSYSKKCWVYSGVSGWAEVYL